MKLMYKVRSLHKLFPAVFLLFLFLILCCQTGISQNQTSDVGNFYPLLDSYSQNHNSSLSFLEDEWSDVETWRTEARQKMDELLGFDPENAPLNPEVLDSTNRDGYTQYLVRYNLNAHQQTEAFLLIPDNLTEPAPAVIALHDHGGFYYYGKEKHNRIDDPPVILKNYIENLYEGRTYADELAKRGFVVLSPDAIYFGSQRIDPEQITPAETESYFENLPDNIDDKIDAYNDLAGDFEIPMQKTILASGTTWPGIIVQGDRKAIDYLLTLPEVDPDKIGAMGLSLGGLRTTYLFGMDSRIKTGVIVAFSSSYQQMFQRHLHHTWMMYVPRQYQFLDLPDVASLNAPRPLMIQNAKQDQLFNMQGMQAAEKKLNEIYDKMGAADNFSCLYYDVSHSMTIPMQEDAFSWLEKWLK